MGELYLFTSRNLMLSTKWLIKNNIDDRTVCFRGNYDATLEDIKNFKVYWKQY